MSLSKRDREFRLPKISYLDFKHLEMDRVLTALFARLAHNGYPSRLRRKVRVALVRKHRYGNDTRAAGVAQFRPNSPRMRS